MRDDTMESRQKLKELLDDVSATGEGDAVLSVDEALSRSIDAVIKCAKASGRLWFIGNGGSASIASHISVDFWKNAGIRAHAFNDPALLTAVSNDYGYRDVFAKPIEIFMERNDILIAISSSGQSENILRAAKAARAKGAKVITLSGFKEDNPLRKSGGINFYVPSEDYGHVEVIHLFICHCLLDITIQRRSKENIKKEDE